MAKKKSNDLDLKFKKVYAKAMMADRTIEIKTALGHESYKIKEIIEDKKGENTHVCRLIGPDRIIIPCRSTNAIDALIGAFTHLEDMGKTLNYGN